MAKKQVKKKELEAEEIIQEEKINTKKIQDKQLKWVIAIIIIVFVVFLGTYYGIKMYKYNAIRFNYLGASWVIVDSETSPAYRATFLFGGKP